MDGERREDRLKHLGFVRSVAIRTVVCVANLYNYAKCNAGPLKPAVGAVEGVVAAVVEPVYRSFHAVPDELLVFVDRKVDTATTMFDEHAPPVAKQAVGFAQGILNKAVEVAQEIMHQAQVGGPTGAAHYAASESKEFVLTQTVNVWTRLDRIPPFHVAAEIAGPTAAHLLDIYNKGVTLMSQKGFPLFGYLPLVPLDDIAKAFKQAAESNAPSKEVTAE